MISPLARMFSAPAEVVCRASGTNSNSDRSIFIVAVSRNCLLYTSYNALARSFPERAEKLFAEAEKNAADRYDHLVRLGALYSQQ